jgi:predicted ATPase
MAEQGLYEEGIVQIQEALAAHRSSGAAIGRPYWLGRLAGASVELGRFEDALSALTTAFSVMEENEDRHHEAELHRLKGELLLRQEPSSVAEAWNCFERAIEIARRQSAKSLELRATMSLARLLAKQGRRDEACTMLAEIFNWFTEVSTPPI